VAKTEKRNVVIEITDKGLKEVTTGLTKLHSLIEKIDKQPITVGVSGNTAKSTKEAAASTKKYSESISAADRAAKGFANTTTNSTKAFAKQSQGLGGLVHIYATVAANIWAMGAAFNSLREAADLKAVIEAQEELATNSGRSLNAVTRALKEGSDGALSLAKSLTLANTVASAGFGAKFAKDISSIASGASKALGRDLTDAVERLTKGIAKMEPEILDELGIFVRLDTATRKYAEAHDKLAKDLTETERRQAFANEATEQGIKLYGDLSSEVAGNPYAQLAASLTDVKDKALGVATSFINSTGIINSFAGSVTGSSAAIFLLVQRLTTMAIPELKTFAESFKVNSIKKSTKAIGEFSSAMYTAAYNLGSDIDFETPKVEKSLGNTLAAAKRAGSGMSVAFQLGASSGAKAANEVRNLNAQLLGTQPLAQKAAGAMFWLGKATNTIGKGVAKLGKLVGWIAIAVAAFTALKGVLSSVLDYFGWLDPLIAGWDKLGELTGMWDPSSVKEVSEAVKNLTSDMEAPIKGFKRMQLAMETSFVTPLAQAELMSNVLTSLKDGVDDVTLALRGLDKDGVGADAAMKKIAEGMQKTLGFAKDLGNTKLAAEITAIKDALSKGDYEEAIKLQDKLGDTISVTSFEASNAAGKLGEQSKAVTDLAAATQNYLNSLKNTTKLDKVLDVYGLTGIDDFLTKLDARDAYELKLSTGGTIKEFNHLSNIVASSERGISLLNTKLSETSSDSDKYKVFAVQLSALHARAASARSELETFGEVSKKPIAFVESTSVKEIEHFASQVDKLGDAYLRLIGMDPSSIERLHNVVKEIKDGGSPMPSTKEINDATTGMLSGSEAILKSNEEIRAANLRIKEIQASSGEEQLKNAQALIDLRRDTKLGKVSKEESAIARLTLSLSVEQEARTKKILKLKQEIIIAGKEALQEERSTASGHEARAKIIRAEEASLGRQLVLLRSNKDAHDAIASALLAQEEHSQSKQHNAAIEIEQLNQIAALEESRLDSQIALEEQALNLAKVISPEANFGVEEASLELAREKASIDAISNEYKRESLVIEQQLDLIKSKYLAGDALSNKDAQRQQSLQNQLALATQEVEVAKALNVQKTKELRLEKSLAKIVSPFEKMEKILKRMDENTFSKMAKGANEFGKVTKVNSKLLGEMNKDDKGYSEQKLLGYADQAAALGSMFEEGSSEAKAFGDIEQGIHVARMAAMLVENAAMIKAAAVQVATTLGILPTSLAGASASIVSQSGIPGIAIAAGFAAMVMGMAGGSSGGSSGNPSAGADAYLKKHKETLGENGISGAEDLETNALIESITDLADIDSRLYSSMDSLQGSIVELGKSFKSVGSSAKSAFGGLTDRGISEQFTELPDIGPGQGSSRRPAERTIEDVLLQMNLNTQTSNLPASSIKKASDYIQGNFDDLTAIVITRLTVRKSSTGGVKYVYIEEFAKKIGGQLSEDLSEAFKSTIDTTFDLLLALDPGAHIGSASRAFQEELVQNMMAGFESGSLLSANMGALAFADQDTLSSDLGTSVSLQGLDSEAAAERISEYFNSLSDSMIKELFQPIEAFKRAGEEIGDTLARLVEETAAAVNAFSHLGFDGSIFDPGVMNTAGVQANLAFQKGLFQGFEDTGAWASLAAEFTSVLLTEAQALENSIGLLGSDVASGLERAISQSLSLTSISGVSILGNELQTLATDMEAGAITSKQALTGFRTIWDQYSRVLVAASAGVDLSGDLISPGTLESLGALDSTIMSTVTALGQMLEAEESLASTIAAETAATLLDFTSVLSSIRDTVANLLLGELSPLAPGAKLELAKNSFDGIVEALKTETGPEKRLDLLERVEASALGYLELSKEYYGGAGNYVSEFERVRGILDSVADELSATVALDTAKQTLETMEALYDLEERARQENADGLLAILEALRGEDSSGVAAIEEFYRTELGREADPEGLAFWADQLINQGSTLDQIAASINNSIEGRAYDEGTGGGFGDFVAPPTATETSIEDLYQQELGRASDPEGLEYWTNQVDTGALSLGGVQASINGSSEGLAFDAAAQAEAPAPSFDIAAFQGGSQGLGWMGGAAFQEALAKLGSPAAFAEGGITSGVSIAGEAGPEAVVPLPDGRNIPVTMSGGFNLQPVVDELRELKAQVVAQTEANIVAQEQIAQLLADSNELSESQASATQTTSRLLGVAPV